jgi:hypothetical protein
MLGEQRGEGSKARVIKIDKGLYDRLVEWAQIEGIPLKHAVDGILWHWFTRSSHVPVARQDALNRVRMASGEKREKLEEKARRRPRWIAKAKEAKPRPIQIPTVGLMPKPSTNLPME